ncbi:hypothetical protein AO368_1868 [Moraxella catarrhalis]|nr:hypothetical protein AO368_1868 [Moraxella catarrhalis]
MACPYVDFDDELIICNFMMFRQWQFIAYNQILIRRPRTQINELAAF